jgi:beta-lactamase class A
MTASKHRVPTYPPKSQAQLAQSLAFLEQDLRRKKLANRTAPGARSVRNGFPWFRCIEIATLLTFLQGQFSPSDQVRSSDVESHKQAVIEQPFAMEQENKDLEEKLAAACEVKGLHAGIFVVSMKSGQYAELNAKEAFPAASMIKVPVLASLMSAIDDGLVKQTQMLEIKEKHMTGGSGYLQWRPVGSKVSVQEAAELMMVISDNVATNLLIDLLGGKHALNKQYKEWGLTQTKINNWLGDFEGTNLTSPYDLVFLLARIQKGDLLSAESKKWMFHVMERTRIRTLLPQGLGPGAVIAHKTGDIAGMVGDTGMITSPDGSQYMVCMQVSRPHNDRRANALIRTCSKLIYGSFANTAPQAAPPKASTENNAPAAKPAVHHRHHRRRH